jgi:hypothetical protein
LIVWRTSGAFHLSEIHQTLWLWCFWPSPWIDLHPNQFALSPKWSVTFNFICLWIEPGFRIANATV